MEAHTGKDYAWMRRLVDDYAFLMRQAEYHVAAGRYMEAQQDFMKASLLAPQRPQPHIGLGAVALHSGNLEDAQTAFENACRLDGACAKAYCGLAIVNHCRSRAQDACDMYCRCLDIDGDNMTALLGLLDIAAEQRSFEQIKKYLQKYIVRHPDDVAVILALAAVYLHQEQFAAAREVLFDILVHDPHNATASALLEELDHILINEELERARQMYLMPYC
ncbi:MAG TPA: tetratricopeptide repeat protein [Anaerohalosphaeraceae bacterium]|jgi:cytochrome c-type biogenesis protein CcmH/NrfG|nr:tetratricopeptide repeat protein [Anaerohalosphaeraceae bacterium]HRT50091.1 tetratricopeptide repeat protein [Anaerohalosphaeraceae bacterium]HRT86025.1 tetratricopeptide repeat protein [Anaerohalosphaeraceae bacterium]